MRTFLLGFAAGLAAILVLLPAGIRLLPWYLERPPKIVQGSTLVLSLSGSIDEANPPNLNPFDPPPLTTLAIWDCLRKAAVDSRISGVLLLPDKPGAGWAKLAEIRSSLEAFRRAGKPIVASLRTASSRDYYLASAAQRIWAAPPDFLDLKGFRAELLYARGTLDKLGILPEFEAIGRFKDGADIFTRSSSSPETREVTGQILDARLKSFAGTVAKSRSKTEEDVRALLDRGPFLIPEAKQVGLIDDIGFQDQAEEDLAHLAGKKDLVKVNAEQYQRVPAASLGLAGGTKIAFLVAQGDIARSPIPVVSEDVLDPTTFSKLVRTIKADESIKAVILRIDSPGGDAIASEEMQRDLELLRATKPIVVSMSDIAASGGYALATSGNPILAYPETITGSIGIFFGKVVLTGLYDKLGLRKELLTRGKFADIDSDVRPLTSEGREKLRKALEQSYASFVTQVSKARKRTYAEIDTVAQGRVWLGAQATPIHLVDELGGIDRAIELAKQSAKIANNERITLDVFPKTPGLVESVQRRLRPYSNVISSNGVKAGFWRRIPWSLEIR